MTGYEGHTPGEWQCGYESVRPEYVIWWANYNDPSDHRIIARVEREADAALIAAAPSLLTRVEALETGLRDIERELAEVEHKPDQYAARRGLWIARHLLNNGNGQTE